MSMWVVVTDARRARVFEAAAQPAALREIRDLFNPASHQRTPDDRGQGAAGHSGTQHALAPRTTPREHDAQRFAREVADFLRAEHAANRFGELLLVAAPEWLGRLQAALHDSLRAALRTPLQKDLVQCAPEELLAQLKSLHALR